MGDRAGYRVRSGDEVSHLIRKQWHIVDIRKLVSDVAATLLATYDGVGVIDAGGVALRHDLDLGRLTAALYYVVYEPPFDSIESDPVRCDIADNGLYEIELVEWDWWKVWNYAIEWGNDAHMAGAKLIAEVRFVEGEPLAEGMVYVS